MTCKFGSAGCTLAQMVFVLLGSRRFLGHCAATCDDDDKPYLQLMYMWDQACRSRAVCPKHLDQIYVLLHV